MSQQYPPQQYPPQQYPPQYPPPYPPQYPQYPPPAPQTSTAAVIGLIASILGIIGILPVIGSLVGVIAGGSAKGDIRNRPGQVTGEGIASAAVVIGWIGLALWGLGCCVTALLLAFGVVAVPSAGVCAELSGNTSALPILPMAGLIVSSVCYLKFK